MTALFHLCHPSFSSDIPASIVAEDVYHRQVVLGPRPQVGAPQAHRGGRPGLQDPCSQPDRAPRAAPLAVVPDLKQAAATGEAPPPRLLFTEAEARQVATLLRIAGKEVDR